MKKLAVFAAPLLLALNSSCVLTPVHPERRQTTEWAFDLLFAEPSQAEGPEGVKIGRQVANAIVSPIVLPGAWLCDSLIVNPFDAYFDAAADVYDVVWMEHPNTQELYEERTDWQGEYTRAEHSWTRPVRFLTGGLVWIGDMLVRTNIPVGPRYFGRFYKVETGHRAAAIPWSYDRKGYQPRELGSGENAFWTSEETEE